MTKLKSAFRYFREEIVGTENQVIASFWAVAVVAVLSMSAFLSSSTMSFQGVAGSRESNVNFEYPVEIRRVHVMPGQRVKKGDLLLELNQSDLNTRIRQLSASLGKLKAERAVRDQLNSAVGNVSGELRNDPLLIEIREQEEELSFLEKQKKNLYVFSDIDGIVGSVNFRKGEKAPSFSSLVTLSSESPTFVQGFIHERMHSEIQIGARVKVASMSQAGYEVKGTVVSIGSRIIEMPPRLTNAVNIGVPVWGREVIVQIPESSRLLLGEKVAIAPSVSLFPSLTAHAEEEVDVTAGKKFAPKPIAVPGSLANRTSFEPSGAVYLPELKKFLVVSDDTDNLDSPYVFLMSEDGEVDEQVLRVPGLSELIDLESISADGDRIYLMTSMSTRKKGGLKKERNLFVRVRRSGLELKDTETVNLGKLLREALLASPNSVLRELGRSAHDLDVEGHAIRNGNLLIALKAPRLDDDVTAILNLGSVEHLFRKGAIESLGVWKALALRDEHGEYHASDLVFRDGAAYILGTSRKDDRGSLWRLDEGSNQPKLIRLFEGVNPEGIAFDSAHDRVLITFDQGTETPQYMLLPFGSLHER